MMRGAGANVRALPRLTTTLASWSLVDAELRALRVWLETSRAEHAIVLSGSCYPLVSVSELADELALWTGKSRLSLNPLPHEPWSTRRNDDGGLWRLRRRFVTVGGRVVFVGGIPLRTVRREPPGDLTLCASSQWKIYSRRHGAALLRVLDERPDLLRFWRTTLVPDESCVASILSSPQLVGDLSDDVCDDLPCPPQDVTAHAATLLGIAPPPQIAFDDPAVSPASRRFYAENKRVSNARAKAELGWRPMYPTYREGLAAILAAGG